MKFIIEKREISALTAMVYRAASNKNTIPILSGLLINLSPEQGITMTATDMEIGIKVSNTNVDIVETGCVLVNANYFYDFIKLLPDTLITFTLDKEKARLNISYGRSSSRLNIYQENDYPELPIGKKEYRCSIPQEVLKEGLKKTAFAAATNHFRQVFTGVLFELQEGGILKIVASDTHRLAYFSYTLESKNLEPCKFVIPIRTVNELLRFLDESPETIDIGLSENTVIFYKENFLLLSRLIEGQYPNYETVIPASFSTDLNIKTHILASSLGRAKIIPTDDKFQIQHVQLSVQDNEVILNSLSESMGEISEIIDEIEVSGDQDIKISFNTQYFLDAVKVFENDCEIIDIKLSGALSPALIRNPLKENYLYILVPMRTNN